MAGNRLKSSQMRFSRKKGFTKKKEGGKKNALLRKATKKNRKTNDWRLGPFFFTQKKCPFWYTLFLDINAVIFQLVKSMFAGYAFYAVA